MQIHTRIDRRQSRAASEKVRKALSWSLVFDALLLLFLQPFRPVLVVGESMMPTLGNRQLVIGKRIDGEPLRGEVVVIDYDDESLVKRVAGLAGDRDLPGLDHRTKVPWKHVYVLGDNSKVSVDSRVFGPLPDDCLKYTVVFPIVSRG